MGEPDHRSVHEPRPSRLPMTTPRRDEILAAHAAAVEAGEDTYVDPGTGFTVFTATYHLARGTCCDSGCRHCPYLS